MFTLQTKMSLEHANLTFTFADTVSGSEDCVVATDTCICTMNGDVCHRLSLICMQITSLIK